MHGDWTDVLLCKHAIFDFSQHYTLRKLGGSPERFYGTVLGGQADVLGTGPKFKLVRCAVPIYSTRILSWVIGKAQLSKT